MITALPYDFPRLVSFAWSVVAEVMRLINDNQIVVSPVKSFKVNKARKAALSA